MMSHLHLVAPKRTNVSSQHMSQERSSLWMSTQLSGGLNIKNQLHSVSDKCFFLPFLRWWCLKCWDSNNPAGRALNSSPRIEL